MTSISRSQRSLLALLASITLLASPLGAQTTPPADPVPVHDTFTVASKALGEARRVNVHVPASYRRR
jgi:hypothetical protein